MQQIRFPNNSISKYPFKKQKTQKQKNSESNTFWTSLLSCGLVVANNKISLFVPSKFAKIFIDKMGQINNSLSKNEFQNFEEKFDFALKKSSLHKSGVTVMKITDIKKEAEKILENINKKNSYKNPLVIHLQYQQIYQAMQEGNSLYSFLDKTIYASKNTRLSLFHELGHAFNHNKTKFAKKLQSWRNIHLSFSPLISLFAIFFAYPKLINDDEDVSQNKMKECFANKILKLKNNFVKIAPALVFTSFLPMIVEEGLASFNGEKIAKPLIDKNLFLKMKKTNILGFITYLLWGMSSAASLALTINCKKWILKEKINKT